MRNVEGEVGLGLGGEQTTITHSPTLTQQQAHTGELTLAMAAPRLLTPWSDQRRLDLSLQAAHDPAQVPLAGISLRLKLCLSLYLSLSHTSVFSGWLAPSVQPQFFSPHKSNHDGR
jgi:hypothetical protein